MSAAAIAVWAVPLVASFLARTRRRADAARAVAVAAMIVSLALSLWLVVSSAPALSPSVLLGADEMSSVLLVSSSGLVIAALIGAPRASFDARLTGDVLLVAAATLGVLVSNHVLPFLLGWGLSLVPLAREARRGKATASVRAVVLLGALSVAPMVLALAVAAIGARVRAPGISLDFVSLSASPFLQRWQVVLAPLVVVAVATRAGIFPFHVWVPAVVERTRLPLALPVIISPLGSFALVKVLLGLFPGFVRDFGSFFVVWGAVSACYGALLAIGRDDVRRQLAFLWVSAASSVLAGIGTQNALALSGALFYDVTAAIALTGLLLIAGGVEARIGTADMRRMGGIVRRAPRLATAYLLLGLAVVSFPGTAGFVSEHLFIQGLHAVNPAVAILLLTATAVNGIALVRSYKRVFLGPPSAEVQEVRALSDTLPRESWVLAALVAALIVGWFFPTPLLRVRESVTAALQP